MYKVRHVFIEIFFSYLWYLWLLHRDNTDEVLEIITTNMAAMEQYFLSASRNYADNVKAIKQTICSFSNGYVDYHRMPSHQSRWM